jgi:dTDP-4-amino-4,6-dideoxygalactose transaminase
MLADADLVLPKVQDGARHVYHLYVVRVHDRDTVRAQVTELGVDTGIHYPVALPLLTAYAHLGHTPEDFPHAGANASKLISLPMFGDISEDQARYVAQTLRDVVGKKP